MFSSFRTCKYLYCHCLPKFPIKREVDVSAIQKVPSFKLDSIRPIPIIERIYCEEVDNRDSLCRTTINPNQIESLRIIYAKKGFDFDKISNYLTELVIAMLYVELTPNCLPPNLKALKVVCFGEKQLLNVFGIFPAPLKSLTISRVDGGRYAPSDAFQLNILPASLKHLATNILFPVA